MPLPDLLPSAPPCTELSLCFSSDMDLRPVKERRPAAPVAPVAPDTNEAPSPAADSASAGASCEG